MNDPLLEQALRRALRPVEPPEAFTAQTLARLAAAEEAGSDAHAAEPLPRELAVPLRRRLVATPLQRWSLAAALVVALMLAGSALISHHESVRSQQALAARAQLLQALNIASADINAVREVVLAEEQPRQ